MHTSALRREVRREFKEAVFSSLPDSTFEKFSETRINKNGYWEEEGKEFWLDGELFDVVRKKVEKGTVVYYCINDEKEEKIIEHQNKLTEKNTETENKKQESAKLSFPDILLAN